MKRKLITAVWEITMSCNMRCKHCGSSCEDKLPDELTTEEALKLCDDLGDMGMRYLAISGGEPTTRKDWPLIVKRLRDNGVQPNMISNGWIIDEKLIDKAMDAGLASIAFSIDGLEKTHNFMRKEGSFKRSMDAFELCKKKGLCTSSITTINKRNIGELDELMEVLIEKGVKRWQLQIGLPMGNLEKNMDLVLEPEQIDDIIEFAYKNINDKRIEIHLADCIGYYNQKAIAVRKAAISQSHHIWKGCLAGKHSIGILHNGDIVACTAIRNKEFIEGNIRETSLRELWEDADKFKWNRDMKKAQLKGFCKKCAYGEVCLGGCTNTRLCMEKNIYSENRYCSYSVAVNRENEKIKKYSDPAALYESALALSKQGQYQIAELLTSRALEIEEKNIETLNLHGYLNFMLENYEDAKKANEKALGMNANNTYSNKGMGLSLCKLGEVDRGIIFLKRAMEMSDKNYMDPYYDGAVMLIEHNRFEEAKEILEEARVKSEDFYENNKELYSKICI